MENFLKILQKIMAIIPLVDTYLELQIEKLPITKESLAEKHKNKAERRKGRRNKIRFRARKTEERIAKRMKRRGYATEESSEGQ